MPDLCSTDLDCSGVRVHRTGHDFRDGGFTRAILAHQGMDLARKDLQGDVSQSVNALEALAHAVDCQNRFL
jgi:hypothetical protein